MGNDDASDYEGESFLKKVKRKRKRMSTNRKKLVELKNRLKERRSVTSAATRSNQKENSGESESNIASLDEHNTTVRINSNEPSLKYQKKSEKLRKLISKKSSSTMNFQVETTENLTTNRKRKLRQTKLNFQNKDANLNTVPKTNADEQKSAHSSGALNSTNTAKIVPKKSSKIPVKSSTLSPKRSSRGKAINPPFPLRNKKVKSQKLSFERSSTKKATNLLFSQKTETVNSPKPTVKKSEKQKTKNIQSSPKIRAPKKFGVGKTSRAVTSTPLQTNIKNSIKYKRIKPFEISPIGSSDDN